MKLQKVITILFSLSLVTLIAVSDECENFFIKLSSDSGKVRAYPDGSFHITPDDNSLSDEINVTITPKDDWRLITPTDGKLIISENKRASYRVMSVLGEDSSDGDVHQCEFPSSVETNHLFAPKLEANAKLIETPFVYAAPDLGEDVTIEFSASQTNAGLHEVVTTYEPCIYKDCGKTRSPSTESSSYETDFDSYSWISTAFIGTRNDDCFTVSLYDMPKGDYEYSATCTAKYTGCKDCEDSASVETNAVVSELTIGLDSAWLGLDRTDAATVITNTATAKLDPEQDLECAWINSSVCHIEPDEFECKIYPQNNTNALASSKYLQEKIIAKVHDAQVTTNFTVVEVDVEIDGIDEDKEETEGAYVACTNGMGDVRTVLSFECKPKILPNSESVKITLDGDNCELLENVSGSWVAVAKTLTVKVNELSNRSFAIRGISPSSDARDVTISIEHETSGAKDKANATVVYADIDIDSDNDNGTSSPSLSDAEDEQEMQSPGKVIVVDSYDSDDDVIPDLADGFGIGESEDFDTSNGSKFTPIVLAVSDYINTSNLFVSLKYSASSPSLIANSNSDGWLPEDAEPLRIWKKDGSEARTLDDYIPPSRAGPIPASSVGFEDGLTKVTLYVEAVSPSDSLGADTIKFEIYCRTADGGYKILGSDEVKLTAIDLEVELVERDGETGDEYSVSPLIYASHPVPVFEDVEITNPILTDSGSITATINGSFYDPMSELLVDGNNRIANISISSFDDVLTTFPVSYEDADNTWKIVDSYTQFSIPIEIDNATYGNNLIFLSAGPNAAGETGTVTLNISVGEEDVEPELLSDFNATASFSTLPSSNTNETITLLYGGGSTTLFETNVALNSEYSGTNTTLYATDYLSFSNETNDTFTCILEFVSNGITNTVGVTFEETSVTSLVFSATSAYLLNTDDPPLKITQYGVVKYSFQGFVSPIKARIVSSLPANEVSSLFNDDLLHLLFFDENVSLCIENNHLYVAGDDRTRLFTALSDNASSQSESILTQNVRFSITDAVNNKITDFEWMIEDPESSSGANNTSRMRKSRGKASTTWTLEDMWKFYDAFYGEVGRFYKEAFFSIGGTVESESIFGFKKVKHINFWSSEKKNGSPIIILDPNIETSVHAAELVYEALYNLNDNWWLRFDYRTELSEVLQYEKNQGNSDAANEFISLTKKYIDQAVDATALACELVVIGASFANEGIDFIVTVSDISDSISEGKYGEAAIGTALSFICSYKQINRAGKTYLRLFNNDYEITSTTVGIIKKLGNRANLKPKDRIAAMASLKQELDNGEINREFLALLYDSGVLKGGSSPSLTLLIQSGWKKIRGYCSHHDLPIKFEREFIISGLDPNSYGRYLQKEVHNLLHSKTGRGGIFNYQWECFLKNNPDASAEDILKFMERLQGLTKPLESKSGMALIDAFDKTIWPYPL